MSRTEKKTARQLLRENVANNIRHLFAEASERGSVHNVKEFARLCNTCQSTAEGWLRDGCLPHASARAQIEQALNLDEGYLTTTRRESIKDWTKIYVSLTAAKPSLWKENKAYEEKECPMLSVAEEEEVYGIIPELREALKHLSRDEQMELIPKIRKRRIV